MSSCAGSPRVSTPGRGVVAGVDGRIKSGHGDGVT